MADIFVKDIVKRFPEKYGWHYVELDESISKNLRPILKSTWPGLLKAKFTLGETSWNSSIMPIKDGPLFIALPANVRKQAGIKLDQTITIAVQLKS